MKSWYSLTTRLKTWLRCAQRALRTLVRTSLERVGVVLDERRGDEALHADDEPDHTVGALSPPPVGRPRGRASTTAGVTRRASTTAGAGGRAAPG